MKLTIRTITLQDMVSRSIKGASNDKLLPLTSLMAIQLKDKKLTLITTDASNYLYIAHNDVEGDDFYVVTYAEQFAKLVSKLTSDTVTLELENMILTVKANGTYKIELPTDENGELIKYPDPLADTKLAKNTTAEIVKLSTIKTILNVNKASLSTEDIPYTGYYVGDTVVTTDSVTICGLNVKMLEKPVLISAETMNLLDVMNEENISVFRLDDVLVFTTTYCTIYADVMEGIDDFEIDKISEYIDEKFKSSCKINRSEALALLDRLILFVGPYDKKAITMTFTEDGIDISSKQSNGIETLPYAEKSKKKFKAFTCQIDIELLIEQLKAIDADIIEMQYGNDASIKFVNDNVTQVIALFDDEV